MIRASRPTVLATTGIALAVVAGATGVAAAAPGTAAVISVSTADELVEALADAEPGDTIKLASGEYEGKFVATAKGTAKAPITLTGSADAVLTNTSYGLHLDGAAHWKLTGFTVRQAKKGIVLDNSNHVVIDKVTVSEIDEEGVHFRRASSDNIIRNSRITNTGLVKPEYGEGVYLGSAKSNWDSYGEDGGPDRSDRNQVLNNRIGPGVAAEAVDIKEGTVDGVVRGNTFDGDGIAGENSADSWIDAKGNDYLIEGNTGTFSGDGALLDGYQTHSPLDGYGCGNTFRANDSDLGGADGYAINVTNQSKCDDEPNVVYDDNTVTGAGKGLTNIDTTS
ncbi:right-handed parallel beta-helix repeat-containing protein [Goodfellowiella coeruleoviolacea]|uniref:Right handed beta helix region n=1 Tax=Goodfellowiella coeruleoviolacea TaxID=334858 RepID=A0AAE3GG88_9PSEU|nr:right-handed parallel beta-helix repeat-containing protein [Goodfellowiella coeruleoviolacea]MCP2166785.1 Right handed beta helix region [Goodfellowiella coeruleoviolacea]